MSENVEEKPDLETTAEPVDNQDEDPLSEGKDEGGEDQNKDIQEDLHALPDLPELPGEGYDIGSIHSVGEEEEDQEALEDIAGEKDKEPEDELHEELGEGEEVGGEHVDKEEKKEAKEDEEFVLEEQKEEVVDPAAPYNITDEKEAMKAPFELTPEQIAECEAIWDAFQDYTYAYTDIKGYVTITELLYMLKAFQIQTFTPAQTQELIEYCVHPPNKDNFVYLEDFKRIVRIRTRDIHIEEAIRAALITMDFDKSGCLDREYFREVITEKGFKMPTRMADNFIKEVDVSGDGILGIEDIVGTMYIDLNYEDMQALRIKVWGETGKPPPEPTAAQEQEEEDDDEDKPPPTPEAPPDEPDF